MLVAQICMWTCVFCAVESLEDIFLAALDVNKAQVEQTEKASVVPDAAKNARDAAKSGLLLLLASLLGAGICRAWAAAEWRHGLRPRLRFTKAIFPVPKLGSSKAWFLTTGYFTAVTVLILSIVTWSRIFDDPLDRVEFAFVSLAACIACNRLLNFLAYVADHSKENKSAALAQSVAA